MILTLSEAIQIAVIENEQEYGLDDLPDLLDIQDENFNHSYRLVNNHANTANDNISWFSNHRPSAEITEVKYRVYFVTERYEMNSVIKPQLIMPKGKWRR